MSHWAALSGRLSVILKMKLKVGFNSFLPELQMVFYDFSPQMPGNIYFFNFFEQIFKFGRS